MSLFRMLTALVSFTMMIDGFEQSREGNDPWLYFIVDGLSFLVGLLSTTGYVRQVGYTECVA